MSGCETGSHLRSAHQQASENHRERIVAQVLIGVDTAGTFEAIVSPSKLGDPERPPRDLQADLLEGAVPIIMGQCLGSLAP